VVVVYLYNTLSFVAVMLFICGGLNA